MNDLGAYKNKIKACEEQLQIKNKDQEKLL
jgi:hypothetical protein